MPTYHMTADSSDSNFDQRSLEAAKWIAIAAMTIDHYGKIVAPEMFTATHAIGRLAYPLFAGIIGLRLATRPDSAQRYLARLIPWAVIAQPAFVVAGRSWWNGNILFTLALGVGAWVGLRALAGSDDRRRGAWLLVVVPASFFTEFGPFGVWMPALTAWAASRGVRMALMAIGPLGVMSNVVLAAPFLEPIDLYALLATPIALASPALSSRLPRLPTMFFYLYYPAHLLALHWLDGLR